MSNSHLSHLPNFSTSACQRQHSLLKKPQRHHIPAALLLPTSPMVMTGLLADIVWVLVNPTSTRRNLLSKNPPPCLQTSFLLTPKNLRPATAPSLLLLQLFRHVLLSALLIFFDGRKTKRQAKMSHRNFYSLCPTKPFLSPRRLMM